MSNYQEVLRDTGRFCRGAQNRSKIRFLMGSDCGLVLCKVLSKVYHVDDLQVAVLDRVQRAGRAVKGRIRSFEREARILGNPAGFIMHGDA